MRSLIGSASISARSAATRPGDAPRTTPTTPVPATPAMLDLERVELALDQRGRFVLFEAQLGAAVDRAAQLAHALDQGFRRFGGHGRRLVGGTGVPARE